MKKLIYEFHPDALARSRMLSEMVRRRTPQAVGAGRGRSGVPSSEQETKDNEEAAPGKSKTTT